MSETDTRPGDQRHSRPHFQRGAAAIEFAIVAIAFLIVVFGILELGRIIYLFNTLSDVTRSAARSATNIDWRNTAELDRARQRALFRDSPGELPFGAPISDQNIRIDYLYVRKVGATFTTESIPSMPSSPGKNRLNCLANLYGSGTDPETVCVRLVRVQICRREGSNCDPVQYRALFPMLNLVPHLPRSTTIVTAETLGYRPGNPIGP